METLVSRLVSEGLIGLSVAAKLFPPYRNNRPVTPSCLLRWVTEGYKFRNGETIKLESIRLVSRYATSKQAVERFLVKRLSASQPRMLHEAAVAVLTETNNPAVMCGDDCLLHMIAKRAGREYPQLTGPQAADRILAALWQAPGPHLVKKYTMNGRNRRVRKLEIRGL